MPFLKWNSLFLLFAVVTSVCAQESPELPVPFSAKSNDGILYNATFKWKDKDFTGRMGIKKNADHFRVVMFTNTGFTLLDILLYKDSTTWKKELPYIDKKSRKKAMEKDLRLLVQAPLVFGKVKKISRSEVKLTSKQVGKTIFSLDEKEIVTARSKKWINKFETEINYVGRNTQKLPEKIVLIKPGFDVEISLDLSYN